jgi:hypothetical protein
MCSAAVATAGLGGFDESTTADSTAPHEFTTDGNNSTSGKDSALVLLKNLHELSLSYKGSIWPETKTMQRRINFYYPLSFSLSST